MGIEQTFEKTYLVRYVPAQIEGAQSEIIEDSYIPATVRDAGLRLRQRGGDFELTKKFVVKAGDYARLNEFVMDLTPEEYEAFKSLGTKLTRKRRYYCTAYGHKTEVDVFLGELDGLILMAFPFASEAEMAAFQPPEVCLAEVTGDKVANGGYLAGKIYAEIQADLERFGYVPQFLDKEY